MMFPDTGLLEVTLTATDAAGCVDDTTASVNVVGPLGTIAIECGDACGPQDTVVATATHTPGVVQFDWDWGNAISTTTSIPTDTYIYTTPGIYPITLTLIDDLGCSYTLPGPPQHTFSSNVTASVAGPIGTCTGDPTSLTVNASTQSNLSDIVSYTWQLGYGSPALTTADPAITHTYASGVYDLGLQVLASDGCTLDIDLPEWVTVTRPELSIAADTSVCPGEEVISTVVIENADYPPYTFAWSCNTPPCSNLSSTATQVWTADVPTTLSVEVTDTFGCTATASRLINVFEPPVVEAAPDTRVCEGESVALGASVTFSAVPIVSSAWSPAASVESPELLVTPATPTQTTTYTIEVVDENTCTGRDTLFVRYFALPRARIAGPDTACPGDLVTLRSTDGTSWLWSTGETTESISYTHQQNDRAFWVIPFENDCEGPVANDTVFTARPLPKADFFIRSAPPHWQVYPIDFQNLSEDASSYIWTFGDGNTSSIPNPSHQYSRIGDYTVSLTAIGVAGCRDTATHPILVQLPYARMPSAFSPNGDDLNETFFPILNGAAVLEMQVFNRWGEVLFEGEGLPPVWDGTDLNGAQVPEGVYVWVLNGKTITGLPFEQTGTVTLIR